MELVQYFKHCPRCKEKKPLVDFHKNKSTSDGHAFYCKPCTGIWQKDYYRNNREHILEMQRANRRQKSMTKAHIKYAALDINVLTDTQKAYLAGFIDADGSLGVNADNRSTPPRLSSRLTIGNTNLEVLQTIQKMIGDVEIYYHPRTQEKWKGVHELIITKYGVLKNLLEQIIPFMILKKRRGELLLEFCDIRFGMNNRPYPERGYEIWEELKILNKRGTTKNE